MGRLSDAPLESYNFRERANIVAGTAMGIAFTISLLRNNFFPESTNISQEVQYWAISTLMAAVNPLSVVTGFFGYYVGMGEASYLKRKRTDGGIEEITNSDLSLAH